jgi:hypothetical protein
MARISPRVLIVDFNGRWGASLQRQLVRQSIRASLVSTSASALAFARSNPVLAALVGEDETPQTLDLSRDLGKLGVETIFLLTPSNSASITAAIMRPGHGVLQRQTLEDLSSAIRR